MHRTRNEKALLLQERLTKADERIKALDSDVALRSAEIVKMNAAAAGLQDELALRQHDVQTRDEALVQAREHTAQLVADHAAAIRKLEARIAELHKDLQQARETTAQNDFYRQGYNKLQQTFDDDKIGKVGSR